MNLVQKYYLPYHFPLRKEFAGILIIILIFLIFPYAIRLIDITAAPIDPGIFSAIILAVSAVLIFKAVTWWVIKAIWPVFARFSDQYFEYQFIKLNGLEKVLIYLGFYVFIFYAFVLVLLGLL